MNREPSVPRYPPQIIQSHRSCYTLFHSPSPAIPFCQPAPRYPPKPFTCGRKHIVHVQEEVQIMSQLVGHGFSMSWPCNSWCTAALFLLFIEHYTGPQLSAYAPKKKSLLHSCPSPKIFLEISTFALFSL